MKDLLKFLAVVVLISAIWGVWTHKRAAARDPLAGVVWDATPQAPAPKGLFDDVLTPDQRAAKPSSEVNPYAKYVATEPVYTISEEERARQDRHWADVRAQQDRDSLARAQQEESYQRARDHREQMRAIENARREAQRAARGY